MISNRKKASSEDLAASYNETGSVWKTAEIFGMCGQSVHERLSRLGLIKPANTFTENDKNRLIAEYQATVDAGGLSRLAAEMGRTKQFLCRQARRLGLTDQKRKASPIAKENIRKGRVGIWKRRPHPRGMLGKSHNERTKKIISDVHKLKWITDKTFEIGLMSPEARQKRSDLMSFRQRTDQRLRKGYSRGKGGRRPDLNNQHFRSSWEANYARYLNLMVLRGEIERWEFEPDTFWFESIKRGVRSYLPDFKVYPIGGKPPFYVEIKGWMDSKSKTKLKRMKKYYPEIVIKVIGAKAYKLMDTHWGPEIPGWEKSGGTQTPTVDSRDGDLGVLVVDG